MTQLDVRNLANDKLPTAKFPVGSHADFRLHLRPDVRRNILQHSKEDVSVEICGVLVGNWYEDENGPYVDVSNYIRCDNASSKFAEVTFTHESWAQINKAMDSQFDKSRIVGWYHSHPDFGIFLSDRDCFIHEHFFSGSGQVAYVVDPVRDLEGMFAWRKGKPEPLPYFWIGDQIQTVVASQRKVGGETAAESKAGTLMNASRADAITSGSSSPHWPLMALALVGLFYLGYLYGGWRSRWEQQMIVEGAVAHFADTKMIRVGLESDLSGVHSRLDALVQELDKLPAPGVEIPKEQIEETSQRRKTIRDNLVLSSTAVDRIEKMYGLSDIERGVLEAIAAQKQAELRRMEEALSQPAPDKQPQPQPKVEKPAPAGVVQPIPNGPGPASNAPAPISK